jgi:hypothetical protein
MSDVASETFIPLPSLVGSRMYSVTFILDYQQLAFDGPDTEQHAINTYSRTRVGVGDSWFVSGEPGYRDALCNRVGGIVRIAGTDDAEKQIIVTFADDAIISISLRPEDFTGPEAAEYICYAGKDERLHVVWQDE